MSRGVTFKKLLLLSERDSSARSQPFLSPHTLLLGTNGTGKSRITKGLFWALGCAPSKFVIGAWDPDIAAALYFEWRGEEYFVLRQGKRLGMFGGDGDLLFAADRMSAWDRHVADFFGYKLKLSRHQGAGYAPAGPSFLTLPFYMDQDGSWAASWDTYTDLTQFSKWKGPVFEAFVGVRPNAYFEAKSVRDEIHARLLDKKRELDAQKSAFQRVAEVLPENLPTLNYSAYRKELAELGQRTVAIQRAQANLRAKLVATVNEREKLQSEIRLAQATQRELSADLSFLSDIATEVMECPTCGTMHKNSFHARLQLSQDADTINALVSELRRRLDIVGESEKAIRQDLSKAARDLDDLDKLVKRKKAKLELGDVAAAHGKKTLDQAFMRVNSDLGEEIKVLGLAEDKQQVKLQRYEDPKRQAAVKKYYADQVRSFSTKLNVDSSEQIARPKPGGRSAAGGSSAARSMLAVHLAMLRSNVEYGDSPEFPFVVDTPQQSGQANENLQLMIESLVKAAGKEHQVILAIEEVPPGTDLSGYEVISLEQKQGVLGQEAYSEVRQMLVPPLAKLREHLDSAQGQLVVSER